MKFSSGLQCRIKISCLPMPAGTATVGELPQTFSGKQGSLTADGALSTTGKTRLWPSAAHQATDIFYSPLTKLLHPIRSCRKNIPNKTCTTDPDSTAAPMTTGAPFTTSTFLTIARTAAMESSAASNRNPARDGSDTAHGAAST